MTQVLGLGAGGHAKVVIDILRLVGGYDVMGLLDPKQTLWGTEVLGVPVMGNDLLLEKMHELGVCHVFIGLGTIGDTGPRRRLYELACQQGFEVVQAIHPRSVVSPSVEFGRGVTVMAGAVINAAATLGDNVIVNSGAIVEHDCVIGNHVHIATGAKLASTVQVDEGTHVGLGASIRQCIHIGRNVIVGAGAVVVKDVPDHVVVVGVPARVLREER